MKTKRYTHCTPQLCECGCGAPAPIATVTRRPKGHVKGQPVRFIPGHNAKVAEHRAKISAAQQGARNSNWRGSMTRGSTHPWLNHNYPRSGICEACGEEKQTEYAFKRHPDRYTRNRDDYRELCRGCHTAFDQRPRGADGRWIPM